MFAAITNMAGYATAPKASLYMKHPIKAMRIRRFRKNVKETVTSQRFLLGMGAAALAVPIGLWVGRRMNNA